MQLLSSFLPGRFIVEAGVAADYSALERFHYRPRRPATWAGVWVVRYARDDRSRTGSIEWDRHSCLSRVDVLTERQTGMSVPLDRMKDYLHPWQTRECLPH